MEDISRFFIKKSLASMKKTDILLTIIYPVDEKETKKALELLEKSQFLTEAEEVKRNCNYRDRATVYHLGKLGWRPDDGIEGFSKEIQFSDLGINVVLGVSCDDKQLRATLYRA